MKESAQTGISYIRSVSGRMIMMPKNFSRKMTSISIFRREQCRKTDRPQVSRWQRAMLSAITRSSGACRYCNDRRNHAARAAYFRSEDLKEKLLAAKNAGMQTVCVPKRKRKRCRARFQKKLQKEWKYCLVEHMD